VVAGVHPAEETIPTDLERLSDALDAVPPAEIDRVVAMFSDLVTTGLDAGGRHPDVTPEAAAAELSERLNLSAEPTRIVRAAALLAYCICKRSLGRPIAS
jgi:hypothetical protein